MINILTIKIKDKFLTDLFILSKFKKEPEFTLVFYIQGSIYSKEDYYIRPGIYINHLDNTHDFYGHFMTGLKCGKAEDILSNFHSIIE